MTNTNKYIFTTNHHYPTLEGDAIAIEETDPTRLAEAFQMLDLTKQAILNRTDPGFTLELYVEVVNSISDISLRRCAATGIQILRDYLNGGGLHPGSLVEFGSAQHWISEKFQHVTA